MDMINSFRRTKREHIDILYILRTYCKLTCVLLKTIRLLRACVERTRILLLPSDSIAGVLQDTHN